MKSGELTSPRHRLVDCSYICVSGAGLKIMAYLGAMSALEEHMSHAYGISWSDYLRSVRGISGASAGAVVALALTLQLSAIQWYELMHPLAESVRNLVPHPDIAVLIKNYGIEQGGVLRTLIARALTMAGLSDDITLERMYKLTRREFCCTGTNLNTCKPCTFHHSTHGDMRVVDAVFISACVPILFAPIQYNGDMYVDGSLSRNIPDLFPMEETLMLSLPCAERLRIASWPGYVSALVMIGSAAQKERDAAMRARAKCDVVLRMCDKLRDAEQMDFSMGAQTYQRFHSAGYAHMLGELFPNFRSTVVQLISVTIQMFNLVWHAEDECIRGVDPDKETA